MIVHIFPTKAEVQDCPIILYRYLGKVFPKMRMQKMFLVCIFDSYMNWAVCLSLHEQFILKKKLIFEAQFLRNPFTDIYSMLSEMSWTINLEYRALAQLWLENNVQSYDGRT